jgi:imidazolonepropionase-like amidohydrolase
MRSAREHDIEVVGHVPWSVGIVGALNSGQSSVEHLFGYLEEIETEESKKRRATDFRNLFHAIEFHGDRLAALVSATRVAGVWNTPTMVFFEKRLPFSGAKEAWENASLRKLGHENRATIVGALNKSGARLLLGTDSGEGQGSILPAAIVEELALLVEAGLTPYEALKTGTVNAAAYLERSEDFGILTKGMRADLLLIECDPLSNVSCVKEQSGIMISGRWFTKQDLGNMLKADEVKD